MVDSLALSIPTPAESPLGVLGPNREAVGKASGGSPKTQKPVSGSPSSGSPDRASDGSSSYSSSALAYYREDLEIRYQSKDGDVLEVRRSVTVAAGYSRSSAGPQGAGLLPEFGCAKGARGAEGCGEIDGEKDGLAGALKWVRDITRQLEEQHARLLESLLKGGKEGKGTEEGRFVMFDLVMVSGRMGPDGKVEAADEATDEEYGVPSYWNAENTSDRIVAFATSFAGIFGNDPEFADTMIKAVADGFAQAGEILGELPGKAGKLNRDTRDLVFGKLDKWVEAWKTGAYNGEAQIKALEPA